MNSFDQLIKPSCSGFFVLTKSCESFYLFDAKNTSPIRNFTQKSHPISNLIISPTQNTLIGLPRNKSLLCFYSVNSPASYLRCGTVEKFTSGTITKNADFCILGSIHGNVFIFNSITGILIGSFRISTKPILFVEISPCGYFALMACGDNHVYIVQIQEMITRMIKSALPGKKVYLGELISSALKNSVTQYQWKSTDEQIQLNQSTNPENFIIGNRFDI